jgi:hypothetical protein
LLLVATTKALRKNAVVGYFFQEYIAISINNMADKTFIIEEYNITECWVVLVAYTKAD